MVVVKEQNKLKPYSIEKRVYQDQFWFKGFFQNMQPEWSGWVKFENYTDLKSMQADLDILNRNKAYVMHKVEYRAVKS